MLWMLYQYINVLEDVSFELVEPRVTTATVVVAVATAAVAAAGEEARGMNDCGMNLDVIV